VKKDFAHTGISGYRQTTVELLWGKRMPLSIWIEKRCNVEIPEISLDLFSKISGTS
jgi:hypothetical protein